MKTPAHWIPVRCSRPINSAISAVTTHIMAMNTLDFPTPRRLMDIAQSENAKLEQSTDRQRIGSIASQETYVGLKFFKPLVKNIGKKYKQPMRNWYITMTCGL